MDHLTLLLLSARDGDRRAFERFVAETQADVWRLCHYLGDAVDADDLAQETHERAIGSLHRYRAEGAARSCVARRVCVDHTRRALDVPVGTIRSRVSRARLDLVDRMTDEKFDHRAGTHGRSQAT